VVVQCTSCQAKFRIADDKVTERGVRVRCTSCKNVFQVKKPGAAAASGPGPGSTMELSALDAAAVARPAPPGPPAAPARPPTGPVRPAAAPARPATGPVRAPSPAPAARPPARPAAPPGSSRATGAANGARRLEADDLFGMSELTGDSPLVTEQAAPPRAPPSRAPPAGRPAVARPIPSFDDIDLEVDDVAPVRPATAPVPSRRNQPAPLQRPPLQPATSQAAAPVALPGSAPPPPGPAALDPFELAIAATPPPLPEDLFEDSAAAPPPAPSEEEAKVTLGAFKTQLKDPFEGMNLGLEGTGAIELSTAAPPPKKEKEKEKPAAVEKATPASPEPMPEEPQGHDSASRELVSSALTGLVGAAIALAVVIGAAFSDSGSGWLGFGGGSDIVATRVASGLYDTIAGKPVFFVRGRVENRSAKVRGPVRVIAELAADSGPSARAESIAGAEPTAEDVFNLRTAAEAEKLNRALDQSEVERHVAPGASLPFFAVIAEPPADLERFKLHVRLESLDAWVPPAPAKGAKGR
jgi:predicted Zn finger-like uncharacterized protein